MTVRRAGAPDMPRGICHSYGRGEQRERCAKSLSHLTLPET